MAENWTQEEWDNKRRIVLFKKSQQGSQLQTSFRPVPVGERPPNSICISCIWWAEKQECYVTSVDTIHLLEQLVVAPARFSVEEKNRIRRNLEGFHPLTVSKAKAESEEFFKVIMSFGNPKPRNIEKDVKVFPWKILGQALKKIISKYSASPSSTIPPSTPAHLLTPVSVTGSYAAAAALPPTAGSTVTTDPIAAIGYASSSHHHHGHHSDHIPSPRSLSGGPSWAAAAAAAASYQTGRGALSPALKASATASTAGTNSPVTTSSGLRLSTLPAYDHRTTASAVSSPYGAQSSHHHSSHSYGGHSVSSQAAHTRSAWDGYAAVTDAYSTATQAPSHHAYGAAGGYGDGSQRA
jgi:hypothetical protein